MTVPPALRKEWTNLQKVTRRDPAWWIYRFAVSYMLLSGALNLFFPKGVWWTVPAALGVYLGGMLLWWLVALADDAERARIQQKKAAKFFSGWERGLPIAFFVMSLAWLGHGSGPHQLGLVTLLGFIAVILLFEQSLGAKRVNFELLEAREQALRAKLAPHFIFNTLNTLHAQIDADPRGAQATTERLAQLFRQVIEVSDRPAIPLKQELAFVEAYLGIERARMGERLRVRIEVPEALESAEIPPLSLQVLVENAVKHGVAPLEQGGELRIDARRDGEDVVVSVTDPGPGPDSATGVRPGTGTALETLRQRLAKPGDLKLARRDGLTVASFRWRQA
jgi:signal transduction histidine kinase